MLYSVISLFTIVVMSISCGQKPKSSQPPPPVATNQNTGLQSVLIGEPGLNYDDPGPCETEYLAKQGPGGEFVIHRPKTLGRDVNFKHPILAWANGTGAATAVYGTLLQHLAPHCFVVIAHEQTDGQIDGIPIGANGQRTWIFTIDKDALGRSTQICGIKDVDPILL